MLTRLIGLITIGYTARVLGPENYGLIAFGGSVVAYASILLAPGLLNWGVRAIAQDAKKAGEFLVIVNLTQFGLACIGYAGLILYGAIALTYSEYWMVLLTGLNLFAIALNVDWVFYGLQQIRATTMFSVASSALSMVFLLTCIRDPIDVYRVPVLGAAVPLAITFALYVVLFWKLGVRLHLPSLDGFRTTIFSSIPLGVMGVLIVVVKYTTNLTVKAFLGNVSLGLFFAALSMIQMSLSIADIAYSVFSPHLSRRFAQDERRARQDASLYAAAQVTIAFWIGALLFAEAHDIVRLIYGSPYAEAGLLIKILSLHVIFSHAVYGYTNILVSFKKDWLVVRAVGASAVVVIIGSLTVVPLLGVTGAAGVIVALNLVTWLVSLPTYKQTIGSFHISAWKKPVMGGAAILGTSMALHDLHAPIWFRAPIEVLVYVPFASKVVVDTVAMIRNSAE